MKITKERRKYYNDVLKPKIGQFKVDLDKKLSDEFNAYLERHKLRKKEWLESKINEELNNEKVNGN